MPSTPKIFVVDDEFFSREGIVGFLTEGGWANISFNDSESFLDAYTPRSEACLVLDMHLPGMSGIELLKRLSCFEHLLPVVVVSGDSAITEAVEAMKLGATDFIEKPIAREQLFESVKRALKISREANIFRLQREAALDHIAGLTPRQHEIMNLVLAGHPSKNIASDLGISQRTVENHRASIMHKTGAKSLPALARLVVSSMAASRREPAQGSSLALA